MLSFIFPEVFRLTSSADIGFSKMVVPKLAQWLTALTMFSITWATLTFEWVPVPLDSAIREVVLVVSIPS